MRDFYERHHLSKEERPESAAAQQTLRDLRARGSRYFCVFDRLEHPEILAAVELGFGYPEISNALAKMFKTYTAIDVAASAIVRRSRDAIEFHCVAADLNRDFPIGSAAADVVIAMMVIEHLFDPFHSFAEVARICKPGGHAFVNLPIVTSIKNRWTLLRGGLPMTSTPQWFDQREWDGGHLHYFDVSHVRRLGEVSGLRLEAIYPVGRMFGLKRIFPSLLCGELSFVFSRA